MKKVWFIIAALYLVFFILIPPLQTPDENDHYETIYWYSRGIYPRQPTSFKPHLRRFTGELFKLVDLKTETSNRNFILPNFKAYESSSLKTKNAYAANIENRFDPVTLQSYQTPFYHLSAAMLFKLGQFIKLPLFYLYYFTRLTSTAFYFGLVYFSLQILEMLFKDQTKTRHLWLFFSLNPLVIKSGVSINPDIGMAFFSAWILYLLLGFATQKISFKKIIFLGSLASLATLSKFNGIFTVFLINFFLFVKMKKLSNLIPALLVFNLIFVFLMSPWLFLNYSRYGMKASTQGFAVASGHKLVPRPVITSVVLSLFEFRHTLMHYSGFMGAANERYPFKPFFISYVFFLVVLSAYGLWRYVKSRNRHLWLVLLYFGCLSLFLFMLGYFYKKSGMDWDLQGRYFLNGFFILTVFLGYALKAPSLAKFAVWHYLFILFWVIIPGYYV